MNVDERLKYRDTNPARQWLNRHYGAGSRLKKVLKSYPTYRPPHPASSTHLTEQQALTNYEYFQANKADRVRLIQDLLGTFGVHIDPNAPEQEAG